LFFDSSDILQKFHIRYHTHLYHSLSDKFQPISIVPSLFKDLTKIFFEIYFRKFDQLISLGFRNIKSIYSLSSKSPKDLPGNNELFVWKSKDDLSVISGKQESDICNYDDDGNDDNYDKNDHNDDNDDDKMEIVVDDNNQDDDLNQKYTEIDVSDNNGSNNLKKELINQIVIFSNLCNKMHSLGLIQRTKDVLENTLCEQIELRVVNTCRNVFDKSMLRSTTKWLYSVLYPWLQIVITPEFLDFNVPIKGNN
jgi:hypothetical protein